jgi:sialate O-acetylesterase
MKKTTSMIRVGMLLAISLGAMTWGGVVSAEVSLAGVFADRMVVQRDRPLIVWGTAPPGETVTVEFADRFASVAADGQGRWRITLEPIVADAVGKPLRARIGDAKPGPDHRVVHDVVVGDVWLLAGGSSCGRLVMGLPNADTIVREFAAEPFRLVRTAVVPSKTAAEPVADVKLAWSSIGTVDPMRIPVEAAQLARAIATDVNVPVGVIAITNPKPVECWMSREALAATPDAKPIVDFYAGDVWRGIKTGTYESRMKAWLDYNQKLPLNPLPKPKPDDDTTLPQQEPASVWNGMVAALVPMSIRGIVWHHGEDWQSQNRAVHQGKLLGAMIPAWREAFRDPELPFAVVQLEPHRYATQIPGVGIDGRMAAELREAQREAAEQADAMFVTTIDLPVDPPSAMLARRIADVLHAGVRAKKSGPRLARAETQGNRVVLTFTNTAGGLAASGGNLKGFAVAASPMRWVWANARIEGDTVVVSSPAVPKPEGVRYAWEDAPIHGATLCNAKGHPANPFRTDSHPLVTADNVTPDAFILRFNRRAHPAIEDPALPRVLIIGDSISGHYHERLRLLMEGKANIVGEASSSARPDPRRSFWALIGPRFYRTDMATKGDDLKKFLAESGPWDIVHFNIGIHVFAGAKPGDEKPYAEKLRQVVETIRESGAVCLFANSTGTVADNTIPKSPNYLTNCKAFNAAAEEVMREMGVPVTDIYGLIQPRIKELISADLIHTNADADQMMAELIADRLTETIKMLPQR